MHERPTDSRNSTKSKRIHTTTKVADSQRMRAYGQWYGSSSEASDSSNDPASVGQSLTARGPEFPERQTSPKRWSHQGTEKRKPQTERSAGVPDSGTDVNKKKDELGLTNRRKADTYGGMQRVRIIDRVRPFFEGIVEKGETWVLIVSHAGVNRVILTHNLGECRFPIFSDFSKTMVLSLLCDPQAWRVSPARLEYQA